MPHYSQWRCGRLVTRGAAQARRKAKRDAIKESEHLVDALRDSMSTQCEVDEPSARRKRAKTSSTIELMKS